MSRAKSSKPPVARASSIPEMPSGLEWGILAAILALVTLLDRSAGLRRGVEMMPWPDGLEYAASAVNLANGRGAVLHFGGYSYPSRYTGGYPLTLEFFYRLFGRHVSMLAVPSWILGMLSVLGVFLVARWLFGRAAGAIAALTLALSPVFITYSSLVMSDVPTLFVTICAALMLAVAASDYASRSPSWMRMSKSKPALPQMLAPSSLWPRRASSTLWSASHR